jgi:hypothetical protein
VAGDAERVAARDKKIPAARHTRRAAKKETET